MKELHKHINKDEKITKGDVEKFVINPLSREDLAEFLDEKSMEIIKYFIIKSLFSQPESKIGQRSLPIQIPKEHIEQWFTQALDVKSVGAGSYPIDIYNEREHWGADIKMLNIKVDQQGAVINGDSGEASLGQKFSDGGVSLDELFRLKNYEEIKNKWVLLYREKYNSLKENYPLIKKVFYFFILRPGIQLGGTDFYFTGAVLNLENLDSVVVNSTRSTANSVYLDNFIANCYGNTKIYKAKKRLELRLCPKNWINNDKFIRIKTSFSPDSIDLRNKEVNMEYLEEQIKKMQDIKLKFFG
jgi:hypothetical protein